MRLRRLEEKDAPFMLEWMGEDEIQEIFPTPMAEKGREEVLAFIRQSDIVCKNGQDMHYAIVDEVDEYLGTISLKNVDLASRKAEYAISLRKCARGKGIARLATEEILRIGFEDCGLERIYLCVLSDNRRANRFYEKNGFVLEGEFRKHVLLNGAYHNMKWYSMLREERLILGGVNTAVRALKYPKPISGPARYGRKRRIA